MSGKQPVSTSGSVPTFPLPANEDGKAEEELNDSWQGPAFLLPCKSLVRKWSSVSIPDAVGCFGRVRACVCACWRALLNVTSRSEALARSEMGPLYF